MPKLGYMVIGVYVFTVEGTRFLWWMGALSSGGYAFCLVEGTQFLWWICVFSGGYTFVVEGTRL